MAGTRIDGMVASRGSAWSTDVLDARDVRKLGRQHGTATDAILVRQLGVVRGVGRWRVPEAAMPAAAIDVPLTPSSLLDFMASDVVSWPMRVGSRRRAEVAAQLITSVPNRPRPTSTPSARGEKWQPGFQPVGYETAARRVTPSASMRGRTHGGGGPSQRGEAPQSPVDHAARHELGNPEPLPVAGRLN